MRVVVGGWFDGLGALDGDSEWRGDGGGWDRCGVGAIGGSVWSVTGLDLRTYALAESRILLRFSFWSTGNERN